MRKFLEKLIDSKTARAEELRAEIKKAETADEVRALGETLDAVLAELQDAKDQLDAMDEEDPAEDQPAEDESEASRSVIPEGAEKRGENITMAQFTTVEKREEVDALSSMEYRKAFAQYVRTGEWKYEQRGDEVITVSEIGKVIPNTIMTELIKNLKSYGQLYNRVRKLNVKGGVEFPIEDLVPVVTWLASPESSVSETQDGTINTSVQFGYHIAEARIAQSLLSSVVSLDLLESEIAKSLAEAFVKAFDKAIISGTGSAQPTGILADSRVADAHKITMNATNAVKWDEWRKSLFAKIPLAYRGGGVVVMTVDTWESLIMTMKDTNNRPLYSETYDVATGETICRFNGKEVILVESDLGLYDYSVATSGQAYMIYFKPECYAINSNLQIGFKRYFNEDTNKWINKGLTIADGKLLDVNGVFIIKK